MKKFRDISLHRKISIVTVITITLIVISGFTFDLIKSYHDNYKQFIDNSLVNTELISRYCVTPLDFELKDGVDDVLSKLEFNNEIVYAIVFDKNKNEFSRFLNKVNISDFEINLHETIIYNKINDNLYISNPIKNDGEILGYINICYSLTNLQQTVKQSIILKVIILILLIILAYSILFILQRKITKPILNLAKIASKISQDTNYKIEIKKESNDETGILTDAFSIMLNKIDEKEKGLIEVNSKLKESQVNLENQNIKLKESYEVIKIKNIEITEKEYIFRAFFNNSPIGLLFLTTDFELIEYNSFFNTENLQFDEKIKNKLITNLTLIHPDLKSKIIEHKQTVSFEAMLETNGSGENFYYVAIFFPVPDIENNVKQVGGIIVNNTKRKLNELDLIKSKEKAEESDRLKSAFLANMSHEIRTPMNGILGFANLLKNPELTVDKRTKYVDIIDKSTNQLLALINDILDISKIEAGQLKINKENFNLNSSLNDIYEIFLINKEQKNKTNVNIVLTTSLNDIHSIIYSDENRIKQVIINLLNNAFKFTNEGEINFGYTVENEYLKFFVKDSGVGISDKFQKIIFDRFRQADEDEEGKFVGGTGLGLAISKGIVNLLSGEIWCESVYGNGAQFYFTIPLDVEINKPKVIVENIKSRGKEISGTQILLVEDDTFNYVYVKELLEEFNFNFHWVNNGQKAIDFCKEHPELGIILMDIQLPEVSGYDAVIKIREFNKKVPIIAQTAYAMDGDEQKYLAIGCNEYLSKPLHRDILIDTIKKYI